VKEVETDENALAGQIESNYDETVDSFDTMNLKPELLRGTFEKHILRHTGVNTICRCLRLWF
jgi:hypothetical protein